MVETSTCPSETTGSVEPQERRASTWIRTRLRTRLRLPGPHAAAVALLTAAFAALYVTYALVRHENFQTGLYDLGIYDQALRDYAHFHLPHVPLEGMRGPHDPGGLQLTDHFTPILAVLAPLYWLHDSPATLLVAQGVLFALAIPPLWIFTRRALGTPAAYLVATAYGLSWTLQQAMWFPFHEVTFAVPVMAWMLERFQAGRYRQAALVSLSLLLVKEDMGLVIGVFGGLLLAYGSRRWGAGLLVGGPLGTLFLTRVVMPAMGASPDRDWSYNQFGRNYGQLAEHVLKHPMATTQYMMTPAVKINLLLWLFMPMFFLALRSPLVLLAVPPLAERLLSVNWLYWSTGYHYNAFVVVPLFCAAVDGARRFQLPGRLPLVGERARRLFGPAWAAGVLFVALITLPTWPMWKEMTTARWWHPDTPHVRAARDAIRHVPPGVWVDAPNQVGIGLTSRDKVQLWSGTGDRGYYTPAWILAQVDEPVWPWATTADERGRVEVLKSHGYRVVYDNGRFLVLHNPDGPQPRG